MHFALLNVSDPLFLSVSVKLLRLFAKTAISSTREGVDTPVDSLLGSELVGGLISVHRGISKRPRTCGYKPGEGPACLLARCGRSRCKHRKQMLCSNPVKIMENLITP